MPRNQQPLYKLPEKGVETDKKKSRRRRKKDLFSETSQDESFTYRVIKSVSDFSMGKVRDYSNWNEPMGSELYMTIEEKERRKAIEEKKKLRKRLSFEALGEERRLKNQARKERMKQKKLKKLAKLNGEIEIKNTNKENDDLIRNWNEKNKESLSDYTESSAESMGDVKVTTKELSNIKNTELNKKSESRIRRSNRKKQLKTESSVIKPFIDRPEYDRTDDYIFDDKNSKVSNPLTIGQRAKIYQEYEQKKEMMNMAIDSYCEKLKTDDGRPIRMILIDDTKCIKSNDHKYVSTQKNRKSNNLNESKRLPDNQFPSMTEGEHWEDRLKRRIREDRFQLDQVLIELKQKVEEKNIQKKLIKEQKKLKKEKIKDRKLMIKLLKERIKEENRSMDSLGKKNLLLTMKEQQVADKPIETKMLLSGSMYVLNSNPVKDMLVRMITRSKKEKEEIVLPSKEDNDWRDIVRDKDLEELGDKMEEKCFRKISKEKKRKERKINRKKYKSSSDERHEPVPLSPRKSELALMTENKIERPKSDSKAQWINTKILRKKERHGQIPEEKCEKRKGVNERIMDLWKDMIKKHSNRNPTGSKINDYKAEGDRYTSEELEEINLSDEMNLTENDNTIKKPLKEIKENKFKRKLKLPPIKFRRDLKLSKNLTLNPLTVIQ